MDLPYSPRNRTERLIVIGRVVLAAFFLLAIWLDPTTPARYTQTTYTLLIVYLGYALLLVPLAWRPGASLDRLGLITHLIDLPTFVLLMYLTEGPTSPFFVYFVFALLAAALRWQWWGTLWTALVVQTVFIAMGVFVAYGLRDPDFELNRFIIRNAHLTVVAVLLGYLSAYEQQLRSELAKLAAWPRQAPYESLVQQLLKKAAAILDVPRVLMVWEDPEEPWCYFATDFYGEFRCTQEPPAVLESLVAGPLADSPFLCPDVGGHAPTLLHATSGNLQRWHGNPLDPKVRTRFGIESVISLPLCGDILQGRLFFLDRPTMTTDHLTLGEIVTRQLTTAMDQFYLQQRLQQAAAAEARLGLARDLHDGLLQSLTGAALQLQTVPRLLDQNPPAARERLQAVQALIAAEQRELRAFIQQLKPTPLNLGGGDINLAVALTELGKRIEAQWHLRVELTVEALQGEISKALTHEIYHLVQEALVNAARHAHASMVRGQVDIQGNQVHIRVADNGGGFPFQGRYDLATLTALQRGPRSLKERVASLSGELILESSGSGTYLEITLPLGPVSRNPSLSGG
jgi:signal transduction histidine kinase